MGPSTDLAPNCPKNGSESEQELLTEFEAPHGRPLPLEGPDEPDLTGDVGDSAETLRRADELCQADEKAWAEDRIALIRRRLSRPVPSGSGGSSTDDGR